MAQSETEKGTEEITQGRCARDRKRQTGSKGPPGPIKASDRNFPSCGSGSCRWWGAWRLLICLICSRGSEAILTALTSTRVRILFFCSGLDLQIQATTFKILKIGTVWGDSCCNAARGGCLAYDLETNSRVSYVILSTFHASIVFFKTIVAVLWKLFFLNRASVVVSKVSRCL
jgi:hypothetical protein